MLAGAEVRVPLTEDGPAAYRFSITRLPASGGNPAGGPSLTDGTFLHVKAFLPSSGGNLLPIPDTPPAPPLYEWDPVGVEIMPPGCTQIFLVGGSGLYGVLIEHVPMPKGFVLNYQPRRRRLLRKVLRNGGSFIVPNGHTGVGTLSATATLTDVNDGLPILLTSAWPYPMVAGTELATQVGAEAALVWTDFEA